MSKTSKYLYLKKDQGLCLKKALYVYVMLFFLFVFPFAKAQIGEYTLKAVFLERFTRFTEWPSETGIEDRNQQFILGVVGETPFNGILEEVYAAQKIRNKHVEIRYITNLNDISGCHMLFISESEKDNISRILTYTKSKPILTVGDTQGYVEKGVHINYYKYENKIRFEINVSAVYESGLSISYLLLNSAKIVNPLKNRQ